MIIYPGFHFFEESTGNEKQNGLAEEHQLSTVSSWLNANQEKQDLLRATAYNEQELYPG